MKKLVKSLSFITATSFVALFSFVPSISIATQHLQLDDQSAHANLNNTNVDPNDMVGQQTISSIKQGSKNYNVTNNMNNIVPFISDGEINYLANNSTNTGIVVIDNNYHTIATSSFYQMIDQNTHITPSIIGDAVPGSNGKYIYMAATYVDDPSSMKGRYSIVWKLEIKTNKTIFLAKIPKVNPDGESGYHGDSFDSTMAIGIIPAVDGDLIIAFPEWLGTGSNSQYINYVIIDTSIAVGTNIHRHYIPSGDLFSFNKDPRIIVESFYVSKVPGGYALTIFGRSRDDGWQNYTILNKALFTIDPTTKEIKITNPQKSGSSFKPNWNASSMSTYQNYASPLLYDQFSYLDKKPQYTASFIKYVSSSKRSINVYNTKDLMPGDHVDQNPTINDKIQASPQAGLPFVQGDISNDGSQQFWLLNNFNEVANSIHKTISLTNPIDNNYYLPNNSSTFIEGFSWADINKTKMVLFDSDNMVSQYDLLTDKYSLLKGVAFASDDHTKEALKQKTIDKSNVRNLVEVRGYNDPKYKTTYNITAVDNTKSIVEVVVAEGSEIICDAKHTFTCINSTDDNKGITKPELDSLYIIVGASVGGGFALVILISLLTYYIKQTHERKRMNLVRAERIANAKSGSNGPQGRFSDRKKSNDDSDDRGSQNSKSSKRR